MMMTHNRATYGIVAGLTLGLKVFLGFAPPQGALSRRAEKGSGTD
jgi:hypothetical protein